MATTDNYKKLHSLISDIQFAMMTTRCSRRLAAEPSHGDAQG
jgi:hypothetical protein